MTRPDWGANIEPETSLWQQFDETASTLQSVDENELPEELRLVVFPVIEPLVSDGYAFALYEDAISDQMWILKQGGIAGASQWFGPTERRDPEIQLLLEFADLVDRSHNASWRQSSESDSAALPAAYPVQ